MSSPKEDVATSNRHPIVSKIVDNLSYHYYIDKIVFKVRLPISLFVNFALGFVFSISINFRLVSIKKNGTNTRPEMGVFSQCFHLFHHFWY